MKNLLAFILLFPCLVIISPLFATDYHISPNGSDQNGSGSLNSPWKSLKYACTQVAEKSGHRIVMSAGTFTESGQCELPAGVDLIGAGVGSTIVTASSSFYHGYMGNSYALESFIIKAGEWWFNDDGNQEISGFSIDGASKQIYGGLYIRNRNNMNIHDLDVYDTYFSGIWAWTLNNSEIHDISFRNCAWGSEGYVVGALNLSELVDVDIYNLQINEGSGGGRGIRSIGSSGDFFKNVRIFDCDINVYHYGAWNNGQAPNMAFEIWGVKLENCEIFNNNVNNTISIVDGYHPDNGVKTVRVHHNNIIVSETQGYPIELSVHNCEIDNNYIYAGAGGFIIAQWEWTQGYNGWNIHHNFITGISWGYPTTVMFTRKGTNNLRFQNNTVEIDDPASLSVLFIEHGTGDEIYIDNNIIKRTVPQTTGYLYQDCLVELNLDHGSTAELGRLTVRNNIFDGFPGTTVMRGEYATNSYAPYSGGNRTFSGNVFDADPMWGGSGNRPSPYYDLQSGSPAIDAGIELDFTFEGNAPDIGASESGSAVTPPPPPPAAPSAVSVVRINAGGPAYTTAQGVEFSTDLYFNSASDSYFTTEPIDGTTEDALYQTERWSTDLKYDVPVPNGSYTVILHFAEIYTVGINQAGMRVFNVDIEGGAAQLDNYDIFAQVGGNYAVKETFTDIEVTDGVMNIDLAQVVENPKISAIEIIGSGAPSGGNGSNAHDGILPFADKFGFGSNLDAKVYDNWTMEELVNLTVENPSVNGSSGAGVRSVRVSLTEAEMESAGYQSQTGTFDLANSLNIKNNTVFLGGPSTAHRDAEMYCPGEQSNLFANMYEPIWDGGANGTDFNEDNYYAAYVYQTVSMYKDRVKFWAVMDSVDYDLGLKGNLTAGSPDNWWENNPNACDLVKLKAPVQNYVRMLRITYEIVKSIDSTAYVSLGGITYESFLDVLLRNTDNPDNGLGGDSEYPYTAGAYFDVVGFEVYPHNTEAVRMTTNTGIVNHRHSDAAVAGIVQKKTQLETILYNYGYDGNVYPAKMWMVSRTGVSRKEINNVLGGDEVQRNFLLKACVELPLQGIVQMYIKNIGDDTDAASASQPYDLMGLYEDLNRDAPYQQTASDAAVASETMASLLGESVWDQERTNEMQLPPTVKGGAYLTPAGDYIYVLWAETDLDRSEDASAAYEFPSTFGISYVQRQEWHTSQTGFVEEAIDALGVTLDGTPAFFTEDPDVASFPVELLSFEAIPRPRREFVRVKWATASENGNDFFTVEKSLDGLIFEAIVHMPTQGNSTIIQNYRFDDLDPIEGVSYYRLKQTDIDGAFTYSDVVEVNYDPYEVGTLTVYPVPVVIGDILTIDFSLPQVSDARIELKSVQGRTVWSTLMLVEPGIHSLEVEIPRRGVRPGHYFVIVSNLQETLIKRVTITRQ